MQTGIRRSGYWNSHSGLWTRRAIGDTVARVGEDAMRLHLRGRCHASLTAAIMAVVAVAASAPSAVAQRLSIRTFGASDGLGSSFVNHITQDAAGYVWLATRDGLSRWNGHEFANLSQPAGLATPAIDRIYQARSGEYFVIGNDWSLYSYVPRAPGGPRRARRGPDDCSGQGRVLFRRRHVVIGGKEVTFTHLYQDDRGVLWGGGHGVLIKGLGDTDTAIPLSQRVPPRDVVVIVRAIQEDRSGSLWIGTNWGLFRLLANGELAHYSLEPRATGDGVTALALDCVGRLWIGHAWLGAVVLNTGPPPARASSQPIVVRALAGPGFRVDAPAGGAIALTTANGLPENGVACLLTASDGQVWIGTSRGLARFDGTSSVRCTTADGLCDDIIGSLAEDGDGNLWVATPTGAMRIALGGLSAFTAHEGLSTGHVVSIGELPDGTLYAIGRDWSVNTSRAAGFGPRGSRFLRAPP